MIEISNMKITNYRSLIDFIESSKEPDELKSLLQNLQSHIANKDIDVYEAKSLLSSIDSKLQSMSHKKSQVRKLQFKPTSVSGRAGTISISLLIVSISLLVAVSIALMLLSI